MTKTITKQFYFLSMAALSLLAAGCGSNENQQKEALADSTANTHTSTKDSISGAPAKSGMLDSIVAKQLVKNIPAPVGSINDFEGIFSKTEIHSLDSLSKAIVKQADVYIVVVTLDERMTNRKDFSQAILALANKWGVGQKVKNNGILVGISKELRMIWIRNGLGIEKKLSNDQTSDIIKTAFLPKFKQNNFYEGTKQGIIALSNKAK
ncbi:MAG: hypothetical protein JWP12_2098 [Bacteroidetes bacterium]|nr:hypothetical protein [Bacteroidota bacterium]